MAPDAFAKALVDAGQVPMAIQDIRRAKALSVVLEKALVVDPDGNVVDLAALDADLAPSG
jgi:trigger factor